MATQAIASFGTFLKLGDGASPESFTTIAEVGDINGLKLKGRVKEVLTHSSGQPWVNRLVTILDAGGVSCDINFVPTDPTHSYSAGLLNAFVNRLRKNYQIVFNSDAGSLTWAFGAYLSSFELKAPVDGVYGASLVFEADGQPTLA